MITLTKNGNAVKFQFEDSQHYLMGDGEIQVPVNSLSLIIDESEMVTFKKASSDDIFVSFDPADSNLSTKDGVIQFYKENMVGATGGGGTGSGVTSGQVESMISEALEDYPTNDDLEDTLDDYYTSTEIDSAFNTVQGELALKADGDDLDALDDVVTAHTANTNVHVTSADKTAWNNKVDATQVETQIETYFTPKEEVIATSLNDLNDRMDDKAEATAVTALNSSLTAHTADTTIHTTTAEKAAWNAKQTALTAGTGIDITNNVISVTASTGGSNVVELTQAQYEALVDKDPDVLYVITDAPEINISGKADTSAVTVVSDALTAHTANTTVHTTSAEKTTWNGKQDALVSGTNIKTINNQSLLGSGNIDIQGGGGGGISSAQCQTMIEDYCDPKEEVIATSLNDLNDRVEDLETGGSSVVIASAITSSSTNDEAAGALATYNAITAATTGGGASYSAGTNISIDTANTINCTLNLSNGSKDKSIKAGRYVDANNYAEVSFGYYNKSNGSSSNYGNNSGSTLFSIGNGYGVVATQRHNAFEIRQNGDIYCSNGTSDVKLQDYLQVKVVKISQSDYDALVQGGTVDANTLYIITNVVS